MRDMVSLMTRLRYRYMSRSQQGSVAAKCLTPIGVLVLVFLAYRWLASGTNDNSYGVVRTINTPDEQAGEIMTETEMNAYLRAMRDTRPQTCHGRSYGGLPRASVSIILDFNEEQFYDLKLTLTSVLEHTPEYLYREILVLDDGTVKSAVREHAARFLTGPRWSAVKAFRSEDAHGPALSRYKGVEIAKGDVLVFLSSSVVVNSGWLEPLVKAVEANRKAIFVPHHDNLLPGYRFFPMDENIGNMFGWTLTTVHHDLGDDSYYGEYLRTPAMRGDVFAVDRNFLRSVGNYDDKMDGGGGHNLELSIRTWLCGGEVLIAPCSRVAVHSALRPQPVASGRNFRRIAELWLGEEYKHLAYHQGGITPGVPEHEQQDLRNRQAYMKHKLPECKDFTWYLEHVMVDLILPSDNSQFFGKLKTQSGHCIRTSRDLTVDMVVCRPHMYGVDRKTGVSMLFDLTSDGHLQTEDQQCLQPGSHGKVVLVACRPKDSTQRWIYHDNGHITNQGDPTKCLAQADELDQHQEFTYYPIVETCRQHHTHSWTFIKY